jgi:predicted HTH transcriptional regulator
VITDAKLSPCKGKSFKESGWGKPELIDKYELQEVELRLPIPNETGGQTDGQTGGQTGGQTRSPKTIEKVFELIKDNPYITRQELVDKLAIKASAIQKHIEKLKAQKRIERVGSSTFGGHWEIKE